MAKKIKRTEAPTKPSGVSATLSAAISIDLIQKQQDKNNRRMGVLMAEFNQLQGENSRLEIQRQEALREFDRTTK